MTPIGRLTAALAALLGLAVWIGLGATGAAAAEARRFDGVQLRIAVRDPPTIGGPARVHAQTWAQRTGGRVEIVEIPYDKLFDSLQASLAAGRPDFDVIFYLSGWVGDLAPHLAAIPAGLADAEIFDDIHAIYRDQLMRWKGRQIAVTVDGDLFMGYYRKDLFEDADNRREFEARYGYELAPPATWSQYRDIARFFTGRKDHRGQTIYGSTEAFALGTQQFWNVFSRAAAYTNPPGSRGEQFFDPVTFAPQIANPGWTRAVEDYVEIRSYCPPGSESFGIFDTRAAFTAGRTAMTIDWADIGTLAEETNRSAVAGAVGYFPLPGAMQSWNARSQSWVAFDQPYQVPFLAAGGWVASVPATSRHPLAAWDFISWFASPENSLRDVVRAGTGINPYRLTHFTNIDAWTAALPRAAAARYLQVIKSSLDSPRVALDLRIPGFNEYTTAFEREVFAAVKGERSVEAALTRAAAQWEEISERRGREAQKAIYRAAMGIDP